MVRVAGHAYSEPGIAAALVAATDRFAQAELRGVERWGLARGCIGWVQDISIHRLRGTN